LSKKKAVADPKQSLKTKDDLKRKLEEKIEKRKEELRVEPKTCFSELKGKV